MTLPTAHLAGAVAFVEWLMDRDRKSTGLKELQGKIWEDGYRRGELVGQVFPDVPAALQRWRDQHVQVGIFSSGSVLAQQLLFRHSSAGDLTGLLQWYFDTRVGAKGEADSYRRIAQAVGHVSRGRSVSLRHAARARCRTRRGNARAARCPAGNAPVAAAAAQGYEAISSLDQVTLK